MKGESRGSDQLGRGTPLKNLSSARGTHKDVVPQEVDAGHDTATTVVAAATTRATPVAKEVASFCRGR